MEEEKINQERESGGEDRTDSQDAASTQASTASPQGRSPGDQSAAKDSSDRGSSSQTAQKSRAAGQSGGSREGGPGKSNDRKSNSSTDRSRKTSYRSSGSRSRRGYFRKKVCRLCVNKVKAVDYKDVELLRRFVTDRGKILPRRMTGTCAKHQRMLSSAIKRARTVALLPFVNK